MTKDKTTYGERIRSERLRLGLTQAKICADLSISKPTQISYEAGGSVPMEYLDWIESLGFDRVFIATGRSSAKLAAENLDWKLLGQVLCAIQQWETSHRRTISNDKRGTLARLLYERFIDLREVDPAYLNSLLDLAA